MFHQIKNIFRKRNLKANQDIDPDEIFLDSQNLPEFDTNQFEGRIEKPISRNVYSLITLFIFLVGSIFLYKLWNLQIVQGDSFRTRSDNNSLHKTLIYADRGVIYDRNKVPLVYNNVNPDSVDFSLRVYATSTGLSTVLGYVKYPTKDSSGIYYQDRFDPKDGMEKIYNDILSGDDGTKIIETDVKGNVISESVVQKPIDGENIDTSIDIRLQRQLNKSLLDIANRAGYKGGAGIIMDVRTGEILASSNFPEYDSQIMTDGSDNKKINEWLKSSNHPFLNRIISGLYTPGSIMKLFVAMGVLDQNVISPNKQILSTGSITIPNPFYPDKPSVFMDWKAHGLVDLRRAIAVSSNVYFYEVSGGYKDQKGIGIGNLEKYVRMFGFGTTTDVDFPGEKIGTIPSPEWKKKTFNGEEWRIGDTYNTAIGQYGFQVTPIQVVRAVGAIATDGNLVTPTFMKSKGQQVTSVSKVDLNSGYYKIVKEGMREGVTEGTSQAINFPFVKVASKTGTAQIGVAKDEVNSWVVGFWPLDNPKYAYTVVMERGSKNNQFGAVLVMQEFLDWVHIYIPEYLD
ncbi:MAG: penicillin-binding protein 2 [Parcubacteria bacterium C7867-006]|nr:MAG: penicillin-binding protein 2 [Parcubacteria bacterium C7867-006]